MMENRITESAIEEFTIELLEKQEFRFVYGPDSDNPVRSSFEDVLFDKVRANASAVVAPALKDRHLFKKKERRRKIFCGVKTVENLKSHLGTIAQQRKYKSLLHSISETFVSCANRYVKKIET